MTDKTYSGCRKVSDRKCTNNNTTFALYCLDLLFSSVLDKKKHNAEFQIRLDGMLKINSGKFPVSVHKRHVLQRKYPKIITNYSPYQEFCKIES